MYRLSGELRVYMEQFQGFLMIVFVHINGVINLSSGKHVLLVVCQWCFIYILLQCRLSMGKQTYLANVVFELITIYSLAPSKIN